MDTGRLEAFSDGVLAIVITIMVLELNVPEGHDLAALVDSAGIGLLTYLLSFTTIGIYWNNHHHMFHLVGSVRAGTLWSNLALLFVLSLIPFSTEWVDESDLARTPVIVYGTNLLLAAVAYFVLQTVIIRQQGEDSPLRDAIGRDLKGKLSPVLYSAGILSAVVVDPHGMIGLLLSLGCYAVVAFIWIIPDPRIDRAVREHGPSGG